MNKTLYVVQGLKKKVHVLGLNFWESKKQHCVYFLSPESWRRKYSVKESSESFQPYLRLELITPVKIRVLENNHKMDTCPNTCGRK